MGGLLSAYELNGQQPQALLNKAKQIADKLSAAWVGVRLQFVILAKHSVASSQLPMLLIDASMQENSIPFGFVDFTTGKPVTATVRLSYILLSLHGLIFS
jgi:hypothetical protein